MTKDMWEEEELCIDTEVGFTDARIAQEFLARVYSFQRRVTFQVFPEGHATGEHGLGLRPILFD